MTTQLDVTVSPGTWTNVHTTLSLSSGTAVAVQNKIMGGIYLWVGTTAPAGTNGMLIQLTDHAFYNITPGAGEYLFAQAQIRTTKLSVQS